jgi:6-pyruvoyltetrahydropterin/6-carboxytetrahydropterin synthase
MYSTGGVAVTQVTISKEMQFDAGHRVPRHAGQCSNPHGHRYRVIAHCTGDIITDEGHASEGMLIDFGRLKAFLQEVHDHFDHGFVVYQGDEQLIKALAHNTYGWKIVVTEWIPTAENFAVYIYEALKYMIEDEFTPNCLRLEQVEVYETPTSRAVYSG